MGNGESIKLWGDKWLPSLQSPSLQCPLTAELQNAKVSFLINPSTRQWNTQLLPTLFSQMESDQIAKIPLTRTVSEDSYLLAACAVRSIHHKVWLLLPQDRSSVRERAVPFPCRTDETTLEENLELISAM